jgi:phage N-6-adenine-methyltransferase
MSVLAVVGGGNEVAANVASLPALVRRASDALANAVTAAEVLDAKAKANFAYDAARAAARFAKSKGAFDEVMAAVYRSQADALVIEAMAKRRIADEYDAGQLDGTFSRRGEWRKKKDMTNSHVLKAGKITIGDVGLNGKSIERFRAVRDAENECPGITRIVAHGLIEAGIDPTKAAVGRKIKTRLSSYSGDNEWYTPSKYIEMAREVLGAIDVDPASNPEAQATVRADKYYTVKDSGLDNEWHGRVWMNPPYSQPEIGQFAAKLLAELKVCRTKAAIVLTNNSGDTAWHQALADVSKAMCVMRGRIKFESPTRMSNSPATGQSFFYFGPDPDRFADVFCAIGRISKSYWA